jgi:phosphoserine phosphatase RsbU/P
MRIHYSFSLPSSGVDRNSSQSEISHSMLLDFRTTPAVRTCLSSSRLTAVEGLDYYGECRPAGENCGDFFDFVPLQPQGLLLSIGEISERSAGAPIIQSGLQAVLRSMSALVSADVAAVVRKLNQSVCDIAPQSIYATLFCAFVDPSRQQLCYVNAGHETALLFHRGSQRLRRLECSGAVLGLTTRSSYRQRMIPVEPGDVLVAFTDGITESTGPDGCEFCEDGVIRVLQEYENRGAAELANRIREASERFRSGSPAEDDQTVAVARLLDPAANQRLLRRAEDLAMAAA